MEHNQVTSVENEPGPETSSGNFGRADKSSKRHVMRKILLVLLGLILLGGTATGAYWWRDKEAKDYAVQKTTELQILRTKVSDLEKQLKDAKAKIPGTIEEVVVTSCTAKQPVAASIENIKASITSGNTAALEGYMAASVNVIFAASDGLGPRTATQAVGDITSFIDDTTVATWSFSIPASELSSYGTGDYEQYFPATAVVGKSSDGKIISFSFDCNGKISTVLMSQSGDILV